MEIDKNKDKFVKQYEENEKLNITELAIKNNFSEAELVDTIAHLIKNRESMRDYEIEKIKEASEIFLKKLNQAKKEQLLEEIKCFKDILALQKELLGYRRK